MSMAAAVITAIRAIQPEALPAFVTVTMPGTLSVGSVRVSTTCQLDSPARERICQSAVTGTYSVAFEP